MLGESMLVGEAGHKGKMGLAWSRGWVNQSDVDMGIQRCVNDEEFKG